ncbi:unnamed protein product [Protopolystoma xenopodis]|uniref:Uncharacterized protein n=1 Tax=Protopolystoma xenopodis TaxID=117903 RepID=A0A448X0A3_9PLAT|nr:unnamed protein product [Protopolystoma xenopodis]
MEVEEEEQLPLVDVEVIRSNGKLKKRLFRKKSCAGIILNFQSHLNEDVTLNGCRIMGRGAGQIDVDIPRQWLPKRNDTKKHTGREKPMAERGL